MLTAEYVKKNLLDLGNFQPLPNNSSEFANNSSELFSLITQSVVGRIAPDGTGEGWFIVFFDKLFEEALLEKFPLLKTADGALHLTEEKDFVAVMQQASTWMEKPAEIELPGEAFDPKLDDTEATAETKRRIGQELYRNKLEALWGGRCAVTGIGIKTLLRASHAKPWKDCQTGKERLSPYNGFLLTADLDALFDKFLISFADNGGILISPKLNTEELSRIGINASMHLRFVRPEHLPFLAYHRKKFEEKLESDEV